MLDAGSDVFEGSFGRLLADGDGGVVAGAAAAESLTNSSVPMTTTTLRAVTDIAPDGFASDRLIDWRASDTIAHNLHTYWSLLSSP